VYQSREPGSLDASYNACVSEWGSDEYVDPAREDCAANGNCAGDAMPPDPTPTDSCAGVTPLTCPAGCCPPWHPACDCAGACAARPCSADTPDAGTTTDGGDGSTCTGPPGPYGTTAGSRFPPLCLADCSGTMHNIYPLAGPTLVVVSAAWSHPSQQLGMDLQNLRALGVPIVEVLPFDPNYQPATAASCSQWDSAYGMATLSWIDPLQLFRGFYTSGALPVAIGISGSGTIQFVSTGPFFSTAAEVSMGAAPDAPIRALLNGL